MFGGLTKVAMSEPRRFRRRGSLPLPACCHITTSAAALIIGRLVKPNWKRITLPARPPEPRISRLIFETSWSFSSLTRPPAPLGGRNSAVETRCILAIGER
jgi:hypothetical protein